MRSPARRSDSDMLRLLWQWCHAIEQLAMIVLSRADHPIGCLPADSEMRKTNPTVRRAVTWPCDETEQTKPSAKSAADSGLTGTVFDERSQATGTVGGKARTNPSDTGREGGESRSGRKCETNPGRPNCVASDWRDVRYVAVSVESPHDRQAPPDQDNRPLPFDPRKHDNQESEPPGEARFRFLGVHRC